MTRSPESNCGQFYTPASPESNREISGELLTILIKSQIFLFIHKIFLSPVSTGKKFWTLLISSARYLNYYPPFLNQIKSSGYQDPK